VHFERTLKQYFVTRVVGRCRGGDVGEGTGVQPPLNLSSSPRCLDGFKNPLPISASCIRLLFRRDFEECFEISGQANTARTVFCVKYLKTGPESASISELETPFSNPCDRHWRLEQRRTNANWDETLSVSRRSLSSTFVIASDQMKP